MIEEKWVNRGLKETLLIIPIILLVIGMIAVGLIIFLNSLFRHQEAINKQKLIEIAQSNNDAVRVVFEGYYTTLNVTRIALQKTDDLQSPATLKFLAQVANENVFEVLTIDLPDGTAITSRGSDINKSYFDKVVDLEKGEMYITDVLTHEALESP